MHPKIVYPGAMAPVIDAMHRPRHQGVQRNPDRQARPGQELSLADGYRFDVAGHTDHQHLEVLLQDTRDLFQRVMGLTEGGAGRPIRLVRGPVGEASDPASEAHRIRVTPEGVELTAPGLAGLRRAVYWLQDEMLIRRAPVLPLCDATRAAQLTPRIIRNPIAPYRWLSGWELTDPHDHYPDAYLAYLAHAGINGLWVPGLFRHLMASRTIPGLGPTEHRLDKLKDLVKRAGRYGVGIHFFCMEPRAVPYTHPALAAHPQLAGAKSPIGQLLCGSEPMVLDYVREMTATLFTEVPDLAGVIDIYCGERPTTCAWREEDAAQCPRCAAEGQPKALARLLSAFVEGIRAAGSEADFMAWSYFVGRNRETAPIAPLLKIIEHSHPDVIFLGNFEHGASKESCGKTTVMHEYAMSCVGPSPDFVDLANAALKGDRRVYAKLQIGTSYELSSVPYLPIPGIVHDKIKRAEQTGATGSMMTWIPGGFPSPTLRAAGLAAFTAEDDRPGFLQRLAAIEWGENAADDVVAAWQIFAEAWQRYPFDIQVLYWGPITRAPAYQLHLEREDQLAKPYNFGFTRKREPQPWEDQIDRWVGPHTVEEICSTFRAMAEQWQSGLQRLEVARTRAADEPAFDRQLAVAAACRLHFLAAANVYEFYDRRNRLLEADPAEQTRLLERLRQVVLDEIEVCRAMLGLIDREPAIGFESEIFDFSYSSSLVQEKLLQLQDLLPTLEQWIERGPDRAVLERTVDQAEWTRPDRDPDRWGD